jgi:two-component system cell cycle sensor histidine kinase/response regulator CckA
LRKNKQELAHQAEWLAGEVRKATMTLNRLIENLPEGVVLLDAEKQILLANPNGRNFLTVLSNAVNSNMVESIDGKSLDSYLNFDSARKWHEVKMNDPNRYFKVAVQLIDQEHGESGYVAVIIDETEEVAIQLQARHQERLAAVGQFAASMAHDFNNILHVILGTAQLALRDQSLAKKVRDRMTTIVNQANQGSQLIRQILDFSRSAVAEKIDIDLLPLLQEAAMMLEGTLRQDVNIRVEHQINEDYTINVDPNRFRQIVTNLVLNARDAMPQGGEITLRLAHCCFDEKDVPFEDMRGSKWVTFSCSDTGAGISDDILPHVFEPFFSTKKTHKGTGLGLAQVYGLVKQHDGFIDVTTCVNQGTTFYIYLPAR